MRNDKNHDEVSLKLKFKVNREYCATLIMSLVYVFDFIDHSKYSLHAGTFRKRAFTHFKTNSDLNADRTTALSKCPHLID